MIRDITEAMIALVSLSLFVATVAVWAVYLGEIIR